MSGKKSQSKVPLGTSFGARRAGVSVETFRRWLDNGLLPCQRDAAGRRLVKPADLEAFLRERQSAA